MEKCCGIFPVEILFLPRYSHREEDKKARTRKKTRKKVARNNEVLGMLKAGASANQIAKEFGLRNAEFEAKKICANGIDIARLARVESVKQVNERN